jgi:uncharacterized protein (DUF983 family)
VYNAIKNLSPFSKGKKLYSIVHHKCPCCQQGNLFKDRNPYHFKMLDKMPEKCTVCGEDFQRETGFYYGAMMISHALTTIIGVIVHFTVFSIWGWNPFPHLFFLILILLVLFPVIFRTARCIWINFFVDYKKQ